ncbi:MAG: hypothetical protein RBU25_05920 [Lentisphaeria bacterium]|jgi:hypothetical protein|nr:hypothetical protein [Lentisphaeria bacterium]
MKRLADRLCPLLAALLLAGCTSLRRESNLPIPAAALWLPAGYESHLVREPGACPPGSLAEFLLATGQQGESGLRAFAAQFPGAEAEIIAYHRHWARVFTREIRPTLRRHADSPLALEILAGRTDAETMREQAREGLAILHRALTITTDPAARDRLQDLLIVHDIQQLRAAAILETNQTGDGFHSGRLVRTLRENPAPPRFQPWLDNQERAERQLGDLAGRDLFQLREGKDSPTGVSLEETLVLRDPANLGLEKGWHVQWPLDAVGNPLGQTFERWKPACRSGDTQVLWFQTRLLPGDPAPATVAVNLRGVQGTVRAYVDGALFGEHDERGTGRVSCRLPQTIDLQPNRPRLLVLRIERPAGQLGTPALWHRPWLTAD